MTLFEGALTDPGVGYGSYLAAAQAGKAANFSQSLPSNDENRRRFLEWAASHRDLTGFLNYQVEQLRTDNEASGADARVLAAVQGGIPRLSDLRGQLNKTKDGQDWLRLHVYLMATLSIYTQDKLAFFDPADGSPAPTAAPFGTWFGFGGGAVGTDSYAINLAVVLLDRLKKSPATNPETAENTNPRTLGQNLTVAIATLENEFGDPQPHAAPLTIPTAQVLHNALCAIQDALPGSNATTATVESFNREIDDFADIWSRRVSHIVKPGVVSTEPISPTFRPRKTNPPATRKPLTWVTAFPNQAEYPKWAAPQALRP